MTPEMVSRARQTAKDRNVTNVSYVILGDASR